MWIFLWRKQNYRNFLGILYTERPFGFVYGVLVNIHSTKSLKSRRKVHHKVQFCVAFFSKQKSGSSLEKVKIRNWKNRIKIYIFYIFAVKFDKIFVLEYVF